MATNGTYKINIGACYSLFPWIVFCLLSLSLTLSPSFPLSSTNRLHSILFPLPVFCNILTLQANRNELCFPSFYGKAIKTEIKRSQANLRGEGISNQNTRLRVNHTQNRVGQNNYFCHSPFHPSVQGLMTMKLLTQLRA